jgi:hypothetical protein
MNASTKTKYAVNEHGQIWRTRPGQNKSECLSQFDGKWTDYSSSADMTEFLKEYKCYRCRPISPVAVRFFERDGGYNGDNLAY